MKKGPTLNHTRRGRKDGECFRLAPIEFPILDKYKRLFVKISLWEYAGIGLFLLLCLTSCAEEKPPPVSVPQPPPTHVGPPSTLRTQKPYQINGVWYYPIPSAQGYVEKGVASWYGPNFHGHSTADGETYDMYGLTAAHKTLPLGTYVKVTNLNNGRSAVVRINDRGPFVAGRIIDLSYTAAQHLGSYGTGTAPVRVEAVQMASEQIVAGKTYWQPQTVPDFQHGNFAIQIGAFVEQQNADRLKLRMAGRYGKTEVIAYNNQGTVYYRVQVGSYGDLQAARQETVKLRGNGFEGAFAVASDEKMTR